jgi:hypothetical protein
MGDLEVKEKAMNYEELIEKLRSRQPLTDNRLLDEAADAIENLQRAVKAHSDLGNRMSNLILGLVELVLQANAAVLAADEKMRSMTETFKKSVTQLDPCLICVGCQPNPPCEKADCDCMICEQTDCRCKECRDMDKWELQWPEVKA